MFALKLDTGITKILLVLLVSQLHISPVFPTCASLSKSFEVITRITDSARGLDFRLEEKYSAEQARALVKLHVLDKGRLERDANGQTQLKQDTRRTYLVDTREDISVLIDENEASCSKADPQALFNDLGLSSLEIPLDESRRHLIGSARLLQYFCERRSQLKADVSGQTFPERNIRSVRYTTTFQKKSDGRQVTVSVFYPEASMVAQERDEALPITIYLEQASGPSHLVSFANFRATAGDSLSDSATSADIQLDTFILEPALGCSLALDHDKRKSLFSDQDSAKRFSFRADIQQVKVTAQNRGIEFRAQVAYDDWLKRLRVDLFSSENPLQRSRQIFSLDLNRVRHIIGGVDRVSASLIEGSATSWRDSSQEQQQQQQQQESSSGVFRDPGETFRCTSATIFSPSNFHKAPARGELLFGSDSFVYLGLARVRGVRARVLEAVGSQLPFWLEPQAEPDEAARSRFVTLVYLSERSEKDDDTSDARVLLMEIYEMDLYYRLVMGKRTISFFDFTWNLLAIRRHSSLDGSMLEANQDGSSVFSWAQLCAESAQDDYNDEHGQFEFLLESRAQTSSSSIEWLRSNPSERNLALLSVLRERLQLVPETIYELETRVIDTSSQLSLHEEKDRNLLMLAKFNVARLPDKIGELEFVGLGRRELGRSWWFRTVSFRQCFMLAAHRKHEIDFAFDPRQNLCYIAMKPRPSDKNPNEPQTLQPPPAFGLDKEQGQLRIYRAKKVLDLQRLSLEMWANEQVIVETEHLHYRNQKFELGAGCLITAVELLVKRLQIRLHKSRLLEASGDDSVSAPESVSVLKGFGLIEQGQVNRVGYLEQHGSSSQMLGEQTLTLNQCEALCQADFNCKSVSYCLRGAQAECILSQLNFTSAETLNKIKKERNTARFELDLENQQDASRTKVTLSRNRNCAIHNKRYLDYFAEPKAGLITSAHIFATLRPAKDVEDCATDCFRHNLISLKQHSEQVASSLSKLQQIATGEEQSSEEQAQQSALRQAIEANTKLKMSGCYKFFYIDQLKLQFKSESTRARLVDFARVSSRDEATPGSSQAGGYCAVPIQGLSGERPDVHLASQELLTLDEDLEADLYEVGFKHFYEEQYGIKMRRSSIDISDSLALNDFRWAREPKLASIATAKRLLNSGENFQILAFAGKERCAALCFKQSWHLWPQCRSFDVIAQRVLGTIQLRCVLNSLSRADAIRLGRSDLVEMSPSSSSDQTPAELVIGSVDEQRWHFEPREGLMSELEAAQELDSFARLFVRRRVGSTGVSLLLVCLLGLVCGLAMAIPLKKQLTERLHLMGEHSNKTRFKSGSISSTTALDL